MRQLLVVAGVLVVVIGLPLYLVPQNSNEYFSWTVRFDLSAAFLGGSYLAAGVIEFGAARERTWANARIAVPAVLVFTVLTLLITLTNQDQYNYSASGFVQSAGTWAWLAVYAVVPPVMMLVLWLQFRHPGRDPVRESPLPAALRSATAVGGAALVIGGVLLLLEPSAAAWMWSWPVKALTARAIGAWMVGFGIAMAHIAWEADWRRIRAATSGAGALGVLQLIALLRYRNDPDWTAPQTWVYLVVLVGFVAFGVWGWRVDRNTIQSPGESTGS